MYDTVALESLLPDALNPRLSGRLQDAGPEELLEELASRYDPVEIAGSIARFGYFESEPMIVIPAEVEGGPAGKYIVVEGNRRLTAIILLKNPDLAAKYDPDQAELWRELSLSDRIPDEVPVVKADLREDVYPLIGYRHISGIQFWEPWAKARFVTQMVDRYDGDFESVAEAVGEKETAVRSLYRNFKLTDLAGREYGVDVEPVKNDFGVFARAMSSIPIRNFIGAPAPRDVQYDDVRFDAEKPESVQRFFLWVFGAEDQDPVVGESRLVQTQLPTVLASKEAVAVLDRTGNLKEAFKAAGGYLARLTQNLSQAASALEDAHQDLADYRDDEEVQELLQECRSALDHLEEIAAEDRE